jgi:hypothetical protein
VNDFDGATLIINDNNTALSMTLKGATLRINDNNTAPSMTLMDLH